MLYFFLTNAFLIFGHLAAVSYIIGYYGHPKILSVEGFF